MVENLESVKRSAIAMELADMAELQKILIENEKKFASEIEDSDIRHRFESMLAEDEKNIGILETVIVQYGVVAKPRDSVRKMLVNSQKFLEGNDLRLFQKVSQHELMKHKQAMAGMLVQKCAQVVGPDAALAISPISVINMETRAHQEQLKGVIEMLGTREITGTEPDQGLWGRVQEAVAGLSGMFGSSISGASAKQLMDIKNLIRLDHKKVETLLSEMLGTEDHQLLSELFGQLYKDLICHSKAEEETIYPTLRNAYGNGKTKDLFDEQGEMEGLLEEMKSMSPSDREFMERLQSLQDIVKHHTEQEEKGLFAAINDHLSQKEQEQLAKDFLREKSEFLEKNFSAEPKGRKKSEAKDKEA